MTRAGRIKLKKGTSTDHRETTREPTAPTGYCNGLGAEAGTDESRCKQASKKCRTLCLAVSPWTATPFSQGSWKRSWAISSPKRPHFIII